MKATYVCRSGGFLKGFSDVEFGSETIQLNDRLTVYWVVWLINSLFRGCGRSLGRRRSLCVTTFPCPTLPEVAAVLKIIWLVTVIAALQGISR